MSVDETAKAFAIVADKLKESEKTIEVEKKLDNLTQSLGVISKSLDQLKQTSAAQLKESKLQFAMNYTQKIEEHYSRECSSSGRSWITRQFVERTLMSFRQNRAIWLRKGMNEDDRNAFKDALYWYLGHPPNIRYVDTEQNYVIEYA